MAKRMPKAMQKKVERIGRLTSQIVQLNMELEKWLEDSGITDNGYDYMSEHREFLSYDISRPADFIALVNAELEGRA